MLFGFKETLILKNVLESGKNHLNNLIYLLLHIDQYLNVLLNNYGSKMYLIIFLILFCETGLVITPFLPGDSLLFALGALAARCNNLKIEYIILSLWLAIFCGDNTNYWIGRLFGNKILVKKIRFIKKEHLEQIQMFYKKHGAKTVVLARFVPIIRTLAPFITGIGKMKYFVFISFSFVGGGLWVTMFILGGYYFGNFPFIMHNFSFAFIGIILVSILPIFLKLLRQFFHNKKSMSGY
jgi:membrane-associated protein